MRVAVISLHVNWKSTWRISSISQHTTPATTSQVGERTHPHQEAENRYSNPLLDLFRQHGTLKQNKQQKAEVFREMLGHDPQQKFRKNASGKILGWFRPGVDFSRHPFFPKFQHACPEHSVSSLQIRQMIFFYPRFSEWLFNREATKGSREGIYEIKISCSPLGFSPPRNCLRFRPALAGRNIGDGKGDLCKITGMDFSLCFQVFQHLQFLGGTLPW